MKHYSVVAAIIKSGLYFLCVQRDKGKYDYISYKYEFPGGKVEPGETNEEALKREIREELDLQLYDLQEYIVIDHAYPDFSLTMHCYSASCDNAKPMLKEHIDYKWLTKEELNQLDWAAADIPAVEKIQAG
jgi:8-oxo-dGTP diphosphatase